MINLFKSKRKKDIHIALVKRICELLPQQYLKLLDQVNHGIIVGIRELDAPYKNYKRFSLNIDLLNKYEDKSGRCFLIKGISVYDIKMQSFVEVRLVVAYGLLLGYSTPTVSNIDADLNKISINLLNIEYFGEDDYNKLKSIFSLAELKKINPADVYEVEIDGRFFYHIKDLEDGDFIGVSADKQVFKITHDPFEIVKLNGDLSDISSGW